MRRVAGLMAVLAVAACLPTLGAEITFTRDVAPLVYRHCGGCHRPSQSAPFDLITYDDVRKHDRQIVEVLRSGFMPPWLPDAGFVEFVGERVLTKQQIDLFEEWVEQGSREGDPAELPELPADRQGWPLGEPDLILRMPEAFVVPADGVDVFRNFVLPMPTAWTRWVRAVDLRPGNPRNVHHAVGRIDRTRSSRMLAAREPGLGFGSMNMGDSVAPDGQLLSWTPGMMPDEGVEGAAWELTPGTDFVLQMHMLPTGKPEPVQASVGLYFADEPPTRRLFSMMLRARDIDIPAGEAEYVLEDQYRLPVPLEMRQVYPHAHYLGKSIESWAILPDGSRQWLIHIDEWDFNWQDAYRYAEPILVPAGSTVHVKFVYDNSDGNPRNPNYPPKRVVGGIRSWDEMGSLTLVVEPRSPAELARLQEAIVEQDIEKDPTDWVAHGNLAGLLSDRGQLDEAATQYRKTLELNPTRVHAMRGLARVLVRRERLDEAESLLRNALRLNPSYADGHFSLGNVLMEMNRLREAVSHYRKATELKPGFAEAHYNAGLALQSAGQMQQAVQRYQEALGINANHVGAHNNLGALLTQVGRFDEAIEHFNQAIAADPAAPDAHANLGNALLMMGRADESIPHYRRALELKPDSEDVRFNLDLALKTRAERPPQP